MQPVIHTINEQDRQMAKTSLRAYKPYPVLTPA
jgi:hypothetical protein